MKLAPEFACCSTGLAPYGVRVLALALFLAHGTVTSLSPARADEASAPAEARAHYERGREHYQAGRYKEAVIELERALSIDPHSPNLVYNVARVYELLGDMDRAIAYYARYQTMLPPHESEERDRVESTLQRLRGARDNGPVQPANASQPAPPKMKRGVADAAFWITLGTGASAFAASGVTGALALDGNKKAQDFVLGKDGDLAERNQEVRHADRLALATDVLVLCGATLAVTSVLLYLLREKPAVEDEPPTEAGIGFGANDHALMLTFGGTL
jgi:tetratricopeptide (TPR) repeat protein